MRYPISSRGQLSPSRIEDAPAATSWNSKLWRNRIMEHALISDLRGSDEDTGKEKGSFVFFCLRKPLTSALRPRLFARRKLSILSSGRFRRNWETELRSSPFGALIHLCIRPPNSFPAQRPRAEKSINQTTPSLSFAFSGYFLRLCTGMRTALCVATRTCAC